MDRYSASLRLRRQHGFRGYGVYMRLIELCNNAPDKKLRYDLSDLEYDTREDTAFLKTVIEDYGLFVIEDGYFSDVYQHTKEIKEAEEEEQRRQKRSEAAKRGAATRRARQEAKKASEPEPDQLQLFRVNEQVSKTFEESTPDPEPEAQTDESRMFDAVRDEWNKLFGRTYRRNNNLVPTPIEWNNFIQSSKQYTLQDFIDAFTQASREKNFAWQFADALKPANVQRLLSNYELSKRNEKKDENIDFQTQEMIDYGERMGWNWGSN